MSSHSQDHEIAGTVEVSVAARWRGHADPLRLSLVDLVPERAAAELAEAVEAGELRTIIRHARITGESGRARARAAGWNTCPNSPFSPANVVLSV